MVSGGWDGGRGDLNAAREFMASVSGGNGSGSRGGHGGGRVGVGVGGRGAGASGSYKPYNHGVGNNDKLLKELPANFYAPTNVLNKGQFANVQNSANAMDLDGPAQAAASVPTPTSWNTAASRLQPVQEPAASPAAWSAPAQNAASTPGSWETTDAGNQFGETASTSGPWGTISTRAQPAQPASTALGSSAANAKLWNNRPDTASDQTTRPSRAIPIIDPGVLGSSSPPRGRGAGSARGLEGSIHARTAAQCTGPTEIAYGPNGSPVGGIRSFVSRAFNPADQQTKTVQSSTTTPKGIAAGIVPSSGLGDSRWNTSARLSASSVSHTGSALSSGAARTVGAGNTDSGHTILRQTGQVKSTKHLDENGFLKRPMDWDVDQGAVVDNDWLLTYSCERLITHCSTVSQVALGVDDHDAYKALGKVVIACMEVLRVKQLKDNHLLFAEAMGVLAKTQKDAWVQWVKYWRPGPPTANDVLAATDGTVDQDALMQDAPGLGPQTKQNPDTQRLKTQIPPSEPQVPSPFVVTQQAPQGAPQQLRPTTDFGGAGFRSPVQSVASFADQQSPFQLTTPQTSQQPGAPVFSRSFGSTNVQQPPTTIQPAQPVQSIPFGGASRVNVQQAKPIAQRTNPATRQDQPEQPSENMVSMPSRYPHGLPRDFDDPQAQKVFEDFFFQNNRLD